MIPATPHMDAYLAGRAHTEEINPGMEAALRARYEHLLPGLARDLVEANGKTYGRGVIEDKTRSLLTIAALTALGGQTAPQLKIHVAAARKQGASQQEICEAIYQMQLYGGMPAMFNALNAAMSVFEAETEGGPDV